MRFPIQELDVDQYMQTIESLLNDNDCHLFIDTNIISQLYKLKERKASLRQLERLTGIGKSLIYRMR